MSSPISKPPEPAPGAIGRTRVLIVEDEALIAFGLEDVFGEQGYAVVGPFPSCAEAMESVAASPPDLAILDATLSDGSCLELALELRRRGVPFMIYSGRDAFEERPPELDGTVWVEKPSSLERVVRAARALVAESGLPSL